MLLSFFKINKYITFIISMLVEIILTKKAQKIVIKYLGNNKSIFQSKFYYIYIYCFLICYFSYNTL